jgi:predicted Zn-dependent protease
MTETPPPPPDSPSGGSAVPPAADPAARLAAANLDYRAGRWRDAGREYRAVLDGQPGRAVAVAAAYNLGLVAVRAGTPAAARERFQEAVDRDPGGRWAGAGRGWLGRGQQPA